MEMSGSDLTIDVLDTNSCGGRMGKSGNYLEKTADEWYDFCINK